MSVLDMDERLLDLTAQMDLVFSPFLDVKASPAQVDITLVEGAVANVDHLRQIQVVRERSAVLVIRSRVSKDTPRSRSISTSAAKCAMRASTSRSFAGSRSSARAVC